MLTPHFRLTFLSFLYLILKFLNLIITRALNWTFHTFTSLKNFTKNYPCFKLYWIVVFRILSLSSHTQFSIFTYESRDSQDISLRIFTQYCEQAKKFSAWSTPPKVRNDRTRFEHNVNDWKVQKCFLSFRVSEKSDERINFFASLTQVRALFRITKV